MMKVRNPLLQNYRAPQRNPMFLTSTTPAQPDRGIPLGVWLVLAAAAGAGIVYAAVQIIEWAVS